ncbi:MAG: phosphodiester glycosidase family protein [Bacteroidetes bacterium]|nr:phosphodiester glycosidase family protein [Bacteroidota bacterium]
MKIPVLATLFIVLIFGNSLFAQQQWENVDRFFQPLPQGFHVYRTTENLDGKPFIAYYAEAPLKNKKLNFITDTSSNRRLTISQFYQKNDRPLLVMNCTFFSFKTNKSLQVVINKGKMLAYNNETIIDKGKGTFIHPFVSAMGIDKNRNADVAWLYADSSQKFPYASQVCLAPIKDTMNHTDWATVLKNTSTVSGSYHGSSEIVPIFTKWKMQTAFGGGPVLLQNADIKITNNEELKFTGKAIEDKHPRTCIGYTKDGRLIAMVIEGRFPNIAEGATLMQEAKLLKDLGCVEALNLDGGGSSGMLINGIQTIKPSDKEGERPVPAVFIIK